MEDRFYSFGTPRLVIEHRQATPSADRRSLAVAVAGLMTEPVTRDLPEAWHGSFSVERAEEWLGEQFREGPVLVVSERSTADVIGLMLLFEDRVGPSGPVVLRLGYLLAESCWGQGYASELIGGFVGMCRSQSDIGSVAGGVARTNHASRRVLEKNGFVAEPQSDDDSEVLFVLDLAR
ncbi:MAG: GNAT family N-acetyltransferase [Acidimicrobiales bacterium]